MPRYSCSSFVYWSLLSRLTILGLNATFSDLGIVGLPLNVFMLAIRSAFLCIFAMISFCCFCSFCFSFTILSILSFYKSLSYYSIVFSSLIPFLASLLSLATMKFRASHNWLRRLSIFIKFSTLFSRSSSIFNADWISFWSLRNLSRFSFVHYGSLESKICFIVYLTIVWFSSSCVLPSAGSACFFLTPAWTLPCTLLLRYLKRLKISSRWILRHSIEV